MNKWIYGLLLLFFAGCVSVSERQPLPIVERMDIEPFMGKWYVIAATPTLFDAQAFNAVEIYEELDGKVDITYVFNRGSFDGPQRTIRSVGRIDNPGINSDWTIRFFWPLQADYKVIYLEPDYSVSVIAHPSRKYAWILARQATIPDPLYSDIILFLQQNGFDIGGIRRIPQRW